MSDRLGGDGLKLWHIVAVLVVGALVGVAINKATTKQDADILKELRDIATTQTETINNINTAQTQNSVIISDINQLERDARRSEREHRIRNEQLHAFQNCFVTGITSGGARDLIIERCGRYAVRTASPGEPTRFVIFDPLTGTEFIFATDRSKNTRSDESEPKSSNDPEPKPSSSPRPTPKPSRSPRPSHSPSPKPTPSPTPTEPPVVCVQIPPLVDECVERPVLAALTILLSMLFTSP